MFKVMIELSKIKNNHGQSNSQLNYSMAQPNTSFLNNAFPSQNTDNNHSNQVVTA